MTPITVAQRTEHLLVRDLCSPCSTRARGQRLYERLIQWFQRADEGEVIVLSFEGVRFVTGSFLDESVVRLLEECPQLAHRIVLEGLTPFAVEGLQLVLDARGVRTAPILR